MSELPTPFSVDRLERESRGLVPTRPTGWVALDAMEISFRAGDLTVVGGRTGHGKTAFALGLLDNVIEEDGETQTLFFSVEEPELRIFHRLLALRSARGDGYHWSPAEIREHLANPGRQVVVGREGLQESMDWLRTREARLAVVNRPRLTAEEISRLSLAAHALRSVNLVLVDYLDGLADDGESPARKLAELAQTLGVPVVVTARMEGGQGRLSRGPYTSETVQAELHTRRPRLAELADRRSELDSDQVLALYSHRAEYEAGTDTAVVERRQKARGGPEEGVAPNVTRLDVGVLKNRSGERGHWAGLAFESNTGYLRDPHPGEI